MNEKYKSDLEIFFRQRVSQEPAILQRLARFDVKSSILDFCQLCANYSTMLKKHFRSYQELISYSSETFYGGRLQAIKIRGAPLEDVIRFDQIEPDPARTTRGTNGAEVDFILDRLIELLDEEIPPTVGIITPFRDQQTLLSKRLFGHERAADFQNDLRLKVMTFDSCQGEERQVIFYSMVATAREDGLNYVFPVDLHDAEDSVEEKLKVQRLNVGFSRAEEMIWFVLSKPIADFNGSIGRALRHYGDLLEKKNTTAEKTNSNNPMEARLLDWLQKTRFYEAHRDDIELLPQFPLGDYLRQLDPAYQHPAWRADFLLTFPTSKGVARIVLEYDGFEHYFKSRKDIDGGDHERYMLEGDIERQLTLESYGYRFIRVNRFNLGKDPVHMLSGRLGRLFDDLTEDHASDSVDQMQEVAAGLATKTHKICIRCRQIRPQEAFFDRSLKDGDGGHGRICMHCKETAAKYEIANDGAAAPSSPRLRRWG